MSDSTRLKYLRTALVLVGIIFIFGAYSLMIAWPSVGRGTQATLTTRS